MRLLDPTSLSVEFFGCIGKNTALTQLPRGILIGSSAIPPRGTCWLAAVSAFLWP